MAAPHRDSVFIDQPCSRGHTQVKDGRMELTSLQLPGFPMALLSHLKMMLDFIDPATQYAWFG